MTSTTAPTIHFDYASVRVPRGREGLYRDTYRAFGWVHDGVTVEGSGRGADHLMLRRDAALAGRQELADLQRVTEDGLARLRALDARAAVLGRVVGYTLGGIGAVLLGISMFARLDEQLGLSWTLGVIGLVAWAAAPVLAPLARRRDARAAEPRRATQLAEIRAYAASAAALVAASAPDGVGSTALRGA